MDRPQGVLSDVCGASRLTRASRVPLVVDEAHGAHLHFLDEAADFAVEQLPSSSGLHSAKSALSQGADIVVQSTHKASS